MILLIYECRIKDKKPGPGTHCLGSGMADSMPQLRNRYSAASEDRFAAHFGLH